MTTITEARTFVEAAKPATGTGMLDIVFISEGWGSSGYYSGAMLEEAATDKVFPAGTQMFINHPTSTEAEERPVRDLNFLAAVLEEDARYDSEVKGLRGKVKTFSNWREPLSEMAPYIGVSIRAAADVEEGEVEGRKGVIVTKITEGLSVDFVTKAGRGGHVVEVLEHAMEQGVRAHIAQEALQTDVRESISNAVRATYGKPFTESEGGTWTYLRDYDPDVKTAYFTVEDGAGAKTYQQTYDDSYTLIGEAVEVRPTTIYVPVAPTGQSTSTESQEDKMPTIEESRLTALVAAEAQVPVLTSERDQAIARAEEAERLLARQNHLTAARDIVAEAFRQHDVTAPRTVERLAEQFTLTESGDLDKEALTAMAAESAAEIAEARGAGTVRGMGHGTSASGEDISESDLDAALAKLRGSTIVKGA